MNRRANNANVVHQVSLYVLICSQAVKGFEPTTLGTRIINPLPNHSAIEAHTYTSYMLLLQTQKTFQPSSAATSNPKTSSTTQGHSSHTISTLHYSNLFGWSNVACVTLCIGLCQIPIYHLSRATAVDISNKLAIKSNLELVSWGMGMLLFAVFIKHYIGIVMFKVGRGEGGQNCLPPPPTPTIIIFMYCFLMTGNRNVKYF